MRKSLINQVVIVFDDREVNFNDDQAKALFQAMTHILAVGSLPGPVVILEDDLYWTAPSIIWTVVDSNIAALYDPNYKTLTLSLGSQKHMVEPEDALEPEPATPDQGDVEVSEEDLDMENKEDDQSVRQE